MFWLKAAAIEAGLLTWCCCGPLLLALVPAMVWDKIRARHHEGT
jgi:hypothetical protein